jgi:DNA-directed RNA polymerase III subunit RPC6
VQYIRTVTEPQDPNSIIPPSSIKYPTVQDVHKFIVSSNLSQIPLKESDVEELLNTLVYARQLERRVDLSSSIQATQQSSSKPSSSISRYHHSYRLHPSRIGPRQNDGSSNDDNSIETIGQTLVHWAQAPCFNCPIANDCHPAGRISPNTCVYLASWLSSAE